VYTRRKESVELEVPRPLSLSTSTLKTSSSSTTDLDYLGDIIFFSTPTPLSIRQTTRSNVMVPFDRYEFYSDHYITHSVSYSHII
jgi:hypothetical protein